MFFDTEPAGHEPLKIVTLKLAGIVSPERYFNTNSGRFGLCDNPGGFKMGFTPFDPVIGKTLVECSIILSLPMRRISIGLVTNV